VSNKCSCVSLIKDLSITHVQKCILRVSVMWLNVLINFLIATLKPQSNKPSYSNTVIGTLAVDVGGGCYIWYNEEGMGGAAARPGPSSLYQM